ncbi:zinc protease [Flavobacterium sp. 90]|uniref:M16 family metallopeptidase n=1 Tax=unclassified Flavobacterium TaxID=196869 RepID=UPI000EB5403B|nr:MULTISPECIES: insulinase family protein [unclassified Flavobacterium]RKR12027.1 zinc protease [Flavobacterium sp. 81]TCK55799.1 zinc protease [Flavobacterium sp. 90]
MKVRIFLAHFMILGLTQVSAQFKTTIPLRKDVVHGTLSNGMQYFILHNEWPKERADFYFVQNVGAILEDDNQNGLAHFLEHMAFNGTEHFKGKGIINMLAKHGVTFGRDINAYTAHDETVYNLSNVPVKNPVLLDSCLYVLHDWSGFLSLKDAEIDAERGVIHEEWRTRRNADLRIGSQLEPVLYNGSKYGKRDVLGDMDLIEHFKYKQLRDYYKKWYLPNHQAVIVVGDIDPVKIEQQIKKIMGSIPMPSNPAERTYESIPDNDKLLYKLAVDKEAQQTSISLNFKKNKPAVQDIATFENSIAEQLALQMMNNRFREYTVNNETALLGAGLSLSGLTRLTTLFTLSVNPKNGRLLEAFQQAYTEYERAIQNGFTKEELDRVKENMRTSYENQLKNKDKIGNENWASQLQSYFLEASPVMSLEDEVAFVNATLAKLDVNQINTVFRALPTEKNQILTVSGPEKDNVTYPTEADYTTAIQKIKAQKLEPYTETVANADLVTDKLTVKPIAKKFEIKGIKEAKGYVLENGAKVIIYPTTLSQDQILFSAFSQGGTSLLSEKDLASSQIATVLAKNSGLGEFKVTDLQKQLSGKTVKVSPFIGEHYEGFSGSAVKKDLETLLELTYLYFKNPRFETQAYKRIIDYYSNALENVNENNNKIFGDTIALLDSNHSKRTFLLSKENLAELKFDDASKIYKERFSNASDFTFVFVGNIAESDLEILNKFIGNLAGNQTQEKFTDHKIGMAKGFAKEKLIREMSVPKTSIYVHLENRNIAFSDKNQIMAYMLSQLLDKRYLDKIREDEGGSYGVQTQSSLSKNPTPVFSLSVSFDCNPEKDNKLLQIVYDELDNIVKNDVSEKDLSDIKEDLIKSNQQNIKSNSYWMSNIVDQLKTNDKFVSSSEYEKLIKSISVKDIKKYAGEVLPKADKVEVVMQPKTDKKA